MGVSGSQAKYSDVQLAYPEVMSNSDLNYLHERQVSNIRFQLVRIILDSMSIKYFLTMRHFFTNFTLTLT